MLESGKYLLVAGMVLAAVLVPLSLLFLSYLFSVARLRPRTPPERESLFQRFTYECGMVTIGESRVQFNFRFYLFALLFVIFDVEAVFLFPWAARFLSLGPVAFLAMVVFLGLVLVAFVYEWKKGALEWR